MKKLSAGYYSEVVDGATLTVTKTDLNDWYYELTGGEFGTSVVGGSDLYSTKKAAQEAGKYMASHSFYHPVYGWCAK